ncbi:MAG: TonB-dependent receptor [Bryobacterales bacterium]|nr:TonB-dependent receptor [Bryobacterales bacterium]
MTLNNDAKMAMLTRLRVWFAPVCLALCLAALLPFNAAAQITGDVRGTVVDQSGAAVVSATVSLRNVNTGETRTQPTNEQGLFGFALLPIGTYEVRAEAPGFRVALTQTEVRSGQISSVRFNMEVGQVTEVITVEEAASRLDLENAQIQSGLVGQAIQELPVARNPNLFALIAPGTAPVSSNNPFLGSGSFNTNGGRGRGNNITVDNITATDISVTGTGGPLGPLNFTEIQEVKFITNNFSAEYGRNANSQLQYITKSGTNDLHFEAYNFLRNDKLNARPFFDRSGSAAIQRRNQFGYVVGGPVLLPGVYNGKNKTFFLTSFEGVKLRGAGAARIAQVPTAAMLAQVTDPTSRALLDRFQLPAATASAGATGTVEQQAPNVTDSWQWAVKGDHNFNENNRLTARLGSFDSKDASSGLTFIGTNLARFGASSLNDPKQFNSAYTRIFGPTVVNEFRFGYGWSNPGFPVENPDLIGPRITFANGQVSSFGVWEGLPQGRSQRTFQWTDQLSWMKGSHNIKFGADFFYYRADSVFDAVVRPLISFASWDAFAAGTPLTYQQRAGNSVRNNRVSNQFFFVQDDWKVTRRLTVNLGLRMERAGGPREVNGLISNLNFDCTDSLGAAGTGRFGCFALGQPAFNTSNNWGPRVGFAYALNDKTVIRGGYGIAYDFIFLNPITNQRFLPPFMPTAVLQGAASFTGANSFANIVAGNSEIQTQTQASVGQISSTALNFGNMSPVIDPGLRNPQVQQFSLGIQRELPGGMVVKGSYVGSKSTYLQRSQHLNLTNDARLVPAQNLADETQRLPDYLAVQSALNGNIARFSNRIDGRFNVIQMVESSALSNFHSFQSEVTKRYSSGYMWNFSYTVGKSIDDISDSLGVLVNDSAAQQNPLNNRDNRAASQFDLRQRVVIVHSWELPFGRNLSNGFLRQVVHGWGFSSINSFRTGFPVSFVSGARRGISSIPLLGASADVRVNASGAFDITPIPTGREGAYSTTTNPDGVQTVSAYAASLGLSQPLIGNFGTLGRNTHRLNGERNFDWTFFKNFHIREGMRLQFRAEMYNIFNNTSFLEMNRNVSNPNFGQYTNVAQDARFMQMALRLTF